jgi:hypothetical protein
MSELGMLPQEWERHIGMTDVSGANGFVKNPVYGADSQLFVRFDMMPEATWNEVDGEKIVKEITKHEYVWIQRPGDKTQIYHQRAQRRHIRRFPKHYEAFKSGKEQGMLGLPLTSWDYQLSMSDLMTLKLMGIEYVHQLATINDTTLPVLGLQGKHWRAAAQVTMNELADKQKKTEFQVELNERDEHIRALQDEANGTKAELEALKDEIRQMRQLATMRHGDPIEQEVEKAVAKSGEAKEIFEKIKKKGER